MSCQDGRRTAAGRVLTGVRQDAAAAARRAPVTAGEIVGTLDRVPAAAVSAARSVPVHPRERTP
ncbi:hypothetical protein [Streptomyces sp. S186]|uniref:hypothetical protein n=1 Tax=Streptomyces sp. S186 TaxID=3434395 RepID=UPI003F6718F6